MKIMQIIDYATFGEDSFNIAKQCAPYSDIIWFRIKGADVTEERVELMRESVPDAFLSLSLDVELAQKYSYDAVQLGVDSDVKSYTDIQIGYSAHSVEEIMNISADYYTLSPIFYTEKDYEVKPLGLLDISHIDKEVFALGGINTENVSLLKGYSGVAGISFYKDIEKLRAAFI